MDLNCYDNYDFCADNIDSCNDPDAVLDDGSTIRENCPFSCSTCNRKKKFYIKF